MAFGGEPDDNPYAAPQAELAPLVEVGPMRAYGYGGLWRRFLASLIDFFLGQMIGLVLYIPFIPFGMALAQLAPGTKDTKLEKFSPAEVAGVIWMYGMVIGYYAGMESSRYQATLGKMALGLKVVDLSGRRISLGRATGRFFSTLFLSVLPCAVGCIMAAFSKKKQALHDHIAGTLVVKTRP